MPNASAFLGITCWFSPCRSSSGRKSFTKVVPIHNRAEGGGVPGGELVSTEFLQLVRFGLRRADDPLILDSIRVAVALLKTETACGPVWHRYNGDGYGEHDDGSP